MQPVNPDLIAAGQDTQQPAAVPALAARTAPIKQHDAPTPVYFKASIPNCSMHRQDGKRLPFMNGFFKATIQEDIDFIKNEIRTGNPYITHATADEVQQARAQEDPLGVIRETMRPDVEKEILGSLSLEALEALIKSKKEAATKAETAVVAAKVGAVTGLSASAQKAAALAVAAISAHASASGANTGTVGGAAKQ